MNSSLNKSTTLLELLIAVSILGIVVTGLYSIEIFSRAQLTAVDRRAKLQSEVSYVLEHMAKNINKAIGDALNSPAQGVGISDGIYITIYIDANGNGQRDDYSVGYRSNTTDYTVKYIPNTSTPSNYEIIANRISYFNVTYPGSSYNYIFVNATACWAPPNNCGTPNNPAVAMENRVDMPAVSTH